jgi:hypothetical protein
LQLHPALKTAARFAQQPRPCPRVFRSIGQVALHSLRAEPSGPFGQPGNGRGQLRPAQAYSQQKVPARGPARESRLLKVREIGLAQWPETSPVQLRAGQLRDPLSGLRAAVGLNGDFPLQDIHDRVVTILQIKGDFAPQLDIEQIERFDRNEQRRKAFK